MKYRILTTMLAWSLIPAGLPLSVSGQPAGLEVAVLSRDKPVDFALEILPILRKNCLACHNARDTEGDLNLETPATIAKGGESGAVVVPGKAGESLLMRHVRQIEKPFMPPRRNKVSAKKLTPRQLALVESWIDEGAKGEVGFDSFGVDLQRLDESVDGFVRLIIQQVIQAHKIVREDIVTAPRFQAPGSGSKMPQHPSGYDCQ